MPPHRLLIQMAYDTRIPLPRIRHFERKREIFFVRGKAKAVRGTASGKHPAPCAPEERCFMQTDSRMKQKMANEKDPSAPLGMTIRETAFLIFPFISPSTRANLRPFRPPPSIVRRENAASETPHAEGFRHENTAPPVISSESEKSFSFAVKKECERSGQWEPLCSLCLGRTVFHADRSTQEKEHGKRKRSLGCARDDDTRMPLPSKAM